jgi:hypothetical protein
MVLGCLLRAVKSAQETLSAVLTKTNFWRQWADTPMNERQAHRQQFDLTIISTENHCQISSSNSCPCAFSHALDFSAPGTLARTMLQKAGV